MTRKTAIRALVGFFLVVAIAAALAILIVLPPAPQVVAPSAPPDPLVAKGALHIHTVRSDGGGTVDEVTAAAAAAGLDFVVITDHGDGRGLLPPTYQSGVLRIDGAEISSDQGHVVAIGLKPAEYRLGGAAADVIEDVHRLGGIATAAHPTSPRDELAWKDWDAAFDGVEWLNADSEWRDEGSARLAATALAYLLRPAPAVLRTFDRPVAALSRADQIAADRPVAFLAGHDAHARIVQSHAEGNASRGVRLPSYRAMFESFALRALLDARLTGAAETDAATVMRALNHGRVFTALDGLAGPARLAFTARSGGASASMGGRLIPAGPLDFEVDVDAPADARIVLLHDGQERATAAAPRLRHRMAAAPGAYRVEVHLPDSPGDPPVPWIVSSPLYVGLPRVVAPPPVYNAGVPATADRWAVEHASASAGAVSITPEGAELRYELGAVAHSPYAALVHSVSIPPGARAVSFRARAEKAMRVSVQLRAPGRGGAGRRWRQSIYIDPSERTFTLSLAEFQPVPGVASPPRTGEIDSLLFVVDTVNTDPGATGQFSVAGAEWRW